IPYNILFLVSSNAPIICSWVNKNILIKPKNVRCKYPMTMDLVSYIKVANGSYNKTISLILFIPNKRKTNSREINRCELNTYYKNIMIKTKIIRCKYPMTMNVVSYIKVTNDSYNKPISRILFIPNKRKTNSREINRCELNTYCKAGFIVHIENSNKTIAINCPAAPITAIFSPISPRSNHKIDNK